MEGEKEQVSIIIPVFNVEKYIREAVDSVCAQTYPDWELILVDDGSTDQSGIICDEYAQRDPRIQVFHTDNRGVSCARNLGIENASGKWITFLDSDDYLSKNCLEILLKYSDRMDLVVYSTQDVPTGRLTVQSEKVVYYSSLQDIQKDIDRIRPYFYSGVWNKLYLRDKVIMRFDPNLSLGEDWWFNVAYMQDCHGICVLPDILHYHRISTENSLTKRFRINTIEDSSVVFYAQLRLMGDAPKTRNHMNRSFANKVVRQSILLAKNKEYSLQEKKAILDRWASHDFWEEEALNLAAIGNKRHEIFLNLLKHKKTWTALFLCQIFAVILDWKEHGRSA